MDARRWLEELFEYESCGECGGGAENHRVVEVPGIGSLFAQCIVTCDDYEARRLELDRWLQEQGAIVVRVEDLEAALQAYDDGFKGNAFTRMSAAPSVGFAYEYGWRAGRHWLSLC